MVNSPLDILLTAIFAFLVFTNVVGNTFICLVILKKRFKIQFCQGKTAMDYLLVNLAISDIIFAVFVTPRYVLHSAFDHPSELVGDLICKFLTGGSLIWVGGAGSVFSLLLIASDRYGAVVNPHNQRRRISLAALPVLLTGCWVFAILLNLPLFLVMEYDKTKDFCVEKWPEQYLPQGYGVIWLLYGGLLPIPIMAFQYAFIIRALWFERSPPRGRPGHISAAQISRRKATSNSYLYSLLVACPCFVYYIVSFTQVRGVWVCDV